MADGKDTARKDWSANQYLKFEKQRTRPARDLLAQVPLDQPPRRVLDVGCGPGNSTEILREQYPAAAIEGIDSSPDMIAKAGKRLPDIPFSVVDLRTYSPKEPQDLIFSNAVLHWLRADERIPTMRRMVEWLRPGGVLAIQVPDNYLEKSHAAMRAVAEEGPWAPVLGPLKPALDPFESPQELYDGLIPLCSAVDIWHTFYQHPLEDHQGVVEWVKGTGLRPFLDPLGPEDRVAFEKEYLEKLKGLYPVSVDGKVLLRYPRLFLVAVRA
ncbi:uncharacterized protein E0L32_010266 [Thyridium curvatum]|uniref:Methyltransferase domain-containing protein n=1 Tax=Thyridium curvatum TaxID=1093900 RepID=A0A507AN64_9PEZI|nr:uncharacterized protein E0L32_010266 [Thyridium curvatum]TPX08066.1 hypothetical protein E0L32_010266 [Thyridium curvatum]